MGMGGWKKNFNQSFDITCEHDAFQTSNDNSNTKEERVERDLFYFFDERK